MFRRQNVHKQSFGDMNLRYDYDLHTAARSIHASLITLPCSSIPSLVAKVSQVLDNDIFSGLKPYCDLHLEDSNQNYSHNTPSTNDVRTYQQITKSLVAKGSVIQKVVDK